MELRGNAGVWSISSTSDMGGNRDNEYLVYRDGARGALVHTVPHENALCVAMFRIWREIYAARGAPVATRGVIMI